MRVLVTGAAGFIGSNAASRLARSGHDVLAIDNFSRAGTRVNAEWLRATSGVAVQEIDIRDAVAIDRTVREHGPDAVLHLAGQVAVTTSVLDPRDDFETNAVGTFNVLEAVRRTRGDAVFVFASTNKVYGDVPLALGEPHEGGLRYSTVSTDFKGIDETFPLDFHSPYGCSKGSADQYVVDYGRIFGMRTFSLRQSCIYGQRQFGMEDQGWIAWFIIAALTGRPITIFGTGLQVRDVLHIDDLIALYVQILERPAPMTGAFNVGGGPDRTLSLLELVALLAAEGIEPRITFGDWRPGDQRIYISGIERAKSVLGWSPEIGVAEGVRGLIAWTRENLDDILRVRGE